LFDSCLSTNRRASALRSLSDQFDTVGIVEKHVAWAQLVFVDNGLLGRHADKFLPNCIPPRIHVIHAELRYAFGVTRSTRETRLGFDNYLPQPRPAPPFG